MQNHKLNQVPQKQDSVSQPSLNQQQTSIPPTIQQQQQPHPLQQPYHVPNHLPPTNGYYSTPSQIPIINSQIPQTQQQQQQQPPSSQLNLPPPYITSYPNYPPQNYPYPHHTPQQQIPQNTSLQHTSSISSDSPIHLTQQNVSPRPPIHNHLQQQTLKSPDNNVLVNTSSSVPTSSKQTKSQSPLTTEKNPKKRPHSSTQTLSRATVTYPRKRALTACDTCRLKKTKCDNVRPQCGSCERNNIKCQYRTDQNQKDYSSYDPASLSILSKLDVILKDLKQIKGEDTGVENQSLKVEKFKDKIEEFDKCIWDMSLTSLFKWKYFQNELKLNEETLKNYKQQLIIKYDKNLNILTNQTLSEQLKEFENLEKLINSNFSNIINSFFVNIYTKLPIIDVYEIFEILELYQFLNHKIENFSFIKLIEIFNGYDDGDNLPPIISKIYEENKNSFNINKLQNLIHSIPLILMICSIGISSIPINLDNLTTFENSKDEASSIKIGCLNGQNSFKNSPNLNQNRTEIAFKLKKYAECIITLFPNILPTNSILSTQFYIMLNQLYLQNGYPLLAHESILNASKNIMYFLQKNPMEKSDIIGRLYWACLKLECELDIELSPLVPLSGINNFIPPTNFPKIATQPNINYNDNIMKLANKYDDEYTWYFFLTEIAIRKIDNKMFDDFYQYNPKNDTTVSWDDENFIKNEFPKKFIKYLNQYNGVINSLTPEIRNFILQETNTDQIYRRMKNRYEKKHNTLKSKPKVEDDKFSVDQDQIFDSLDDFLIDDDLLLKAQSESIMYIKTRVISSKLFLFRPLVYMFLEDKIPTTEIFESIAIILQQTMMKNQLPILESPNSISTSPTTTTTTATTDNNQLDTTMDMNFYNLTKAPPFYQTYFPDEDFSNLIDYDYQSENNQEEDIKLKDLTKVKKKILIVFIQNLISIPKLNIPKLSSHRHPGSWYFVRNNLLANICQFLIYKKMNEMITSIDSNPQLQHQIIDKYFGINKNWIEIKQLFNLIIDKTSIIAFLEHSLIVFEYWKEEMNDCEIYQEFIKKMLDNL
ncbi:ZCF27 [Candida pseudojiufengensis]|uniref:ZCF27 n=1 Tax=Candida pseudojiufengensis TaxID=497109 RepID=UPI0022245FC8|nr:ZCF27 [Candida pseudojiufengensis]KAI5965749.1 ZCF27 [Candida pseudojiufengensis]